ncbi:MAG: nucleoside 2-deoxyribosyltransferase domain-containing protein [Solirubrobacteraceae bacterium]
MRGTIYAFEPLPAHPARLVYLAGPIDRESPATDWHGEAIRELRSAEFDGSIVVPAPRPGSVERRDAAEQISWEHAAMSRADAILFWIPRVLWSLPGLTTNLEWGIWHDSGKAVLSAPPNAPRMRYLRFHAERVQAPQADSLRAAAKLVAVIATR